MGRYVPELVDVVLYPAVGLRQRPVPVDLSQLCCEVSGGYRSPGSQVDIDG